MIRALLCFVLGAVAILLALVGHWLAGRDGWLTGHWCAAFALPFAFASGVLVRDVLSKAFRDFIEQGLP